MRCWPEDWQVTLGFLGQHYGWSRAELEALTLADVAFWAGCAVAWLAKQKESGP